MLSGVSGRGEGEGVLGIGVYVRDCFGNDGRTVIGIRDLGREEADRNSEVCESVDLHTLDGRKSHGDWHCGKTAWRQTALPMVSLLML